MEVKKCWAFLTLIEEKKAATRQFRRTLHEGHIDAATKVESARMYISFLNDLSSDELTNRGVKDRFKEVGECRRVMEKESMRNLALGSLERMVTSLGQFETE